jgi:hypothetical protein
MDFSPHLILSKWRISPKKISPMLSKKKLPFEPHFHSAAAGVQRSAENTLCRSLTRLSLSALTFPNSTK